jgi:hypothetical protein
MSIAPWDIDAAYTKWRKAAETSEAIAARLAAPLVAEAHARAAAARAEYQRIEGDRHRVAERAGELEQERAEFNKLFGGPEHFRKLKEDLERREAVVRWQEEMVWANAVRDEPAH